MRLDGTARKGWLGDPATRAVMAALDAEKQKARFVGGCVRNALLGRPVHDIDIATIWTPDETIRQLTGAGLKVVPTGLDHGTVTAVANGKSFEVTTLRKDVATDGRRAVVAFTDDWAEDARRRDFTINALYADADGTVFDPLGGLADIAKQRVRFIGDPEQRIREDYLRILRFFRIHSWYGAGALDQGGLAAIRRMLGGLKTLSAERVQKEVLRLLAADDPLQSILAMEETGVLGHILAHTDGTGRLERLLTLERQYGFVGDALLRLGALLPGDPDLARESAAALRLSKAHSARLIAMRTALFGDVGDLDEKTLRALLYNKGAEQVRDWTLLAWADTPDTERGDAFLDVLKAACQWKKPVFPITAGMVMARGIESGPELGRVLRSLETQWVDEGFPPDTTYLLTQVKPVKSS